MQVVHSPFDRPQEYDEWGENNICQKDKQTHNQHNPSAFQAYRPDSNKWQQQFTHLQTLSLTLQRDIQQARQQQQKMVQMFSNVLRMQQGQNVTFKKGRRRELQDVVNHYPCAHCTKVYTTDSSLKRHLKIKHLDVGVDPPSPLPAQPITMPSHDHLFPCESDPETPQIQKPSPDPVESQLQK